MANDWSALGAVYIGKYSHYGRCREQKNRKDRILMSEKDYDRFKQHTEALCFDSGTWVKKSMAF
ncbi:Uncharacterised protein [Salmonella enterica subsp. salamae]|uniref:Uncharacterized protein n=1 Tax=Salmonella enterica subsp. salamae TaxID=59202 RepID=A0A6D2GDN7_SALER|nr:Uncharacterised protein [Salmonella enterica subsp. salamae]